MNLLIASRLSAILLALLVTFLWSTSFVIIKWGLTEIPPITFAGLRYFIAFICLLPFAFTNKNIKVIKSLAKKDWINLSLLGLMFYPLTQGAQFIGLSLIPAVTVSLLLNFTPIVVAFMAIVLISEYPTSLQWFGTFLFLTGIIIYFVPINLLENEQSGLFVMLIGVFANAGSAVLGRKVNRSGKFSPFIVTLVSMGVGSFVLIITGIFVQGINQISKENLFYLLWLAIVNTALAFVLWNKTLQSLSAMESSIINGTMLVQIALLAWIFLGEEISMQEGLGMFAAACGAVLVQLKRK
jgi:drug/metabolite transporter (DMT)-like permease